MFNRRIVENNLNFLNNGKVLINETAGPGWWQALKRMFGLRFSRNNPYQNFMERYANPPGDWPRRLIRINRSGASQWGISDEIRRQLDDLEANDIFKGRNIKQLLINDEGAYIILTDDGSYFYLHPENGPLGPLPEMWDPYRDRIPEQWGHNNWADPGYKGPFDPIFSAPIMVAPILGQEEQPEQIVPPQSIPPFLIRPTEDWRPPMK